MKRTAIEAQQTRQQILLAAVEVFAEQGYGSAGLTEIAARAKVTRGAVYFHFKDKTDVFAAVCRLVAWGSNSAEHQDGAESPLERLRELMTAWIADLDQDGLKRHILDLLLHKTEWTAANEDFRAELRSANDQHRRQIEAVLAQGVAEGEISLPSNLSVEQASKALKAALLGMVSFKLRHPQSVELGQAMAWLTDAFSRPTALEQ
ncbi:TetR family transcriptional regulator [Paucibacter sp. XJ19-41]|uniref:TetR family transcriptional regulator n=1 Tax=Paucibacter sp. XJ19-41 TaxID=2927824 RepID=UPI00234A3935|nr:TetR family transcriptional regulator [Paucibacter sp. XJ19-41]MDC6166622.1 TetR family transcriptional regulator [Paucibacter sp. XJ19-41]